MARIDRDILGGGFTFRDGRKKVHYRPKLFGHGYVGDDGSVEEDVFGCGYTLRDGRGHKKEKFRSTLFGTGLLGDRGTFVERDLLGFGASVRRGTR